MDLTPQEQKKLNRLRSLKQYKDLPDEEIVKRMREKKTRKKVEKPKKTVGSQAEEFIWAGLYDEETQEANRLFVEYRNHNHIEGFNDLERLREYIYTKVLLHRVQKNLANLTSNNKTVPKGAIDSLNSLQKQVIESERNLGIGVKEEKSFLEVFQRYVDGLKKWKSEHSGDYQIQCPGCHKMLHLMFRVNDYDAFEWNMFKGTWLYNRPLMEEVEKGSLTVDRVAEILGVSADYINKIYTDIYLREKKDERETNI